MSNHERENLGSAEQEIAENKGYKEQELLKFLEHYPKVSDLMVGNGFIFKSGEFLKFPSPVSPEEEKSDPELADRAFRRRVAMHSTAVGATNLLLLASLKGVPLDMTTVTTATETMALHDLNKIHEIRWRKVLVSSDTAYNAAEEHMADLLRRTGYPEEFVQLAGSVGHNGARDYLTAPGLWPVVRQCAYLADDLLQETVIQQDPLAKARRLQTDLRYEELNRTGFPERSGHPTFTNLDGSLKRKFDLQYQATSQMLNNVGEALGIPGEKLGDFLIKQATERGIYSATIKPAKTTEV